VAPSSAVYLGWAGSPVSNDVEEIVRQAYDLGFSAHLAFGEQIDQDSIVPGGADYLFSFGPTIVGAALLDRVRTAAINFHTGPPRWPGRGSVSFALLHDDTDFGVTAHLMIDEVDAGPIIRVLRFPISPSDTVESLDARTKEALPRLVELVLEDLSRNGGAPVQSGEQWERAALRQADLLREMRITDADDAASVARKIRAFAHPTKPGPYIERAGERFWYLGEPGG
jgi:methionyl-tRNA formyltransferase